MPKRKPEVKLAKTPPRVLPQIRSLIESAQRRFAATANLELVTVYWNIGKVIDEDVQKNQGSPGYVSQLIGVLAEELIREYGRGFSASNLWDMKRFFEDFDLLQTVSVVPAPKLLQTVSGVSQLNSHAPSHAGLDTRIQVDFARHFHIGWSHYRLLLSFNDYNQRRFYFDQAAANRWSVRALQQQINAALYERVGLSKSAHKLIAKQRKQPPTETIRFEDTFKDPYLLDFLGLKAAYSEKDLESEIIANLQQFLSELGKDFCFIGRQFPMRIDDVDYRLDLLFYHRGLRCLVAIDLKLGAFTAADKGQMDLYLSWLKKHDWRRGENEPVGLILCSSKRRQHVELLMRNASHKMQVSEYRTQLPTKKVLEERLKIYSRLLAEE